MSKMLDYFESNVSPKTDHKYTDMQTVPFGIDLSNYNPFKDINPMRNFSYITFTFLIYWSTRHNKININYALDKTNKIQAHYIDKAITKEIYYLGLNKYQEAIKLADKCSNSYEAFNIVLNHYYNGREERLNEFISEYGKEDMYRRTYTLNKHKRDDLWLFNFIKNELHKGS